MSKPLVPFYILWILYQEWKSLKRPLVLLFRYYLLYIIYFIIIILLLLNDSHLSFFVLSVREIWVREGRITMERVVGCVPKVRQYTDEDGRCFPQGSCGKKIHPRILDKKDLSSRKVNGDEDPK